ncbi:MAG: asparagine synthase-related protein [Legionellaceae bacterium]|nr:asparagine synthase-related protein [Legionellaceae bacterium]
MMPQYSIRPAVLNASGFFQTRLNSSCVIYSASPHESIPITSFEDSLNPLHYRTVFHPFAQVIENKRTGEHLLVRDHMGVRPLYYYHHSDQLIFGDTIPDIIRQLPQAPAFLDSEVAHLFGDVQHYTDNTLYTAIYRVDPGTMVHIKPDGHIKKSVFWQLEQEGETLRYRDERKYQEHFTSLMQASVKHAAQGSDDSTLAAEFSAGMDSTAIYGTCAALGLNPTLFMHEPLSNSSNAKTYNDVYERAFIAQFSSAKIHRVRADNFDPLRVFKDYAGWFGGPAPYIFELFAHNLHQAVGRKGHTRLLSGLGGDQGVSSHIPARFILPELLHNKQLNKAWCESAQTSKLRHIALLLQCAHPSLHALIKHTQDLKLNTRNLFKKPDQRQVASTHPYHRHYFKTLREVEWSFLQGPNSHAMRMRIEHSSIVGKKMGFDYRYPLLYPPLLEFFLSLPLDQKRHQGVGRHMMRRYLAQIMPSVPFHMYQKKEGINIVPATMDTFKAQWDSGAFQIAFENLAFKKLTQDKSSHKAMIKTIQAFMLNERCKITHGHDGRKG